eukprot:jgi/Chrzof1/11174/Cz05g26190.t1
MSERVVFEAGFILQDLHVVLAVAWSSPKSKVQHAGFSSLTHAPGVSWRSRKLLQSSVGGRCASVYTTRAGDTISSVAGKYSLSPEELAAANPQIQQPHDPLPANTQVNIPPCDPTAGANTTARPASSTSPTLPAVGGNETLPYNASTAGLAPVSTYAPLPPIPSTCGKTYTVTAADNDTSTTAIAQKNGLLLTDLLSFNPAIEPSSSLPPGTTLFVSPPCPGQSPGVVVGVAPAMSPVAQAAAAPASPLQAVAAPSAMPALASPAVATSSQLTPSPPAAAAAASPQLPAGSSTAPVSASAPASPVIPSSPASTQAAPAVATLPAPAAPAIPNTFPVVQPAPVAAVSPSLINATSSSPLVNASTPAAINATSLPAGNATSSAAASAVVPITSSPTLPVTYEEAAARLGG